MRIVPLVTLCLLACVPAFAEDEPSLEAELGAFFAEADDAARLGKGFSIAARWPDAAAVARALPTARVFPADAKKDEVITWKRKTPDGADRTVFASIPGSYDAKKAMPVLIWLHGGVRNPTDGMGMSGIKGFGDLSDEEGFLLLSPSTGPGAEWWTPAGVALVRGALADLARTYHVDGNRVALAGFSDGASGVMHIHAHDPDPYAVFLPLMPHPLLTRLAGGPAFQANVRARPMLAISGGRDRLYPAQQVKPIFDELIAAGVPLEWVNLPEAGHAMADVLPDQWVHLRRLWKEKPRDALPRNIAWESAAPELDGRFSWVEIESVDPKASSSPDLKAGMLRDPALRPVLGVNVDRTFEGGGIMIAQVTEDSAAEEAGFLAGDVILAVEGKSLKGEDAMPVLAATLPTLTDHKGVFLVLRDGKEIKITCQPRVLSTTGVPRPKALGFDRPSGRIVARVLDGNVIEVETRQVGAFKLHLADGLVDLEKPVIVKLNGKTVHEGMVKGQVGYALSEALRAGPGAPAWQAVLVLRP